MPDPSVEEIEAFLKSVASLLGTSVSVPDFPDLYDSEDPSTARQIGIATPDEIEAALVMGLQRAEIQLQEAAEEKRVAEQWSIVEGISQRLDSVPPSPTQNELELVDQGKLPDVLTLTNTAAKAVLDLSAARGEPDNVFETATEKALTAIDERDNGIAKQHEAVKAELERRGKVVAEIKEKFAVADKNISPKAKDIVNSSSTAKTVKPLRTALENYQKSIVAIELSVDKNPPNVFAQLEITAKFNIEEIEGKTEVVNNLAISQVASDRKSKFNQLTKKSPTVTTVDQSLVPAGTLMEQYNSSVNLWETEYKSLESKSKEFGTLTDFEEKLVEIARLYELAEEAAKALREAADSERKRRLQVFEQLKQLKSSVKAPETPLVNGTEEQIEYDRYVKSYSDALQKLNALLTKGSPDSFAVEEENVREAIRQLTDAGPKASEKAAERKRVKEEIQKNINESASKCFKAIATDLSNCPIKDVVQWIQGAYTKQVKSRTSQIKGIDLTNDKKLQEELNALEVTTKKLTDVLKNLGSTRFVEVAGNVVVTGEITNLQVTLSNPGIGQTAINIAEKIWDEVGKVLKRYDDIESLRMRFNDATSDRLIVPSAQKVLQAFPKFDSIKDTLDKGQLTIQYTTFLDAIREIEDKKADNALKAQSEEQRKAYLASESYKLMKLMETPGTGEDHPVTKLETLVSAKKASMGDINDAYRSSYDRPDRFSVEVEVLIETYKDVVVHAHCSSEGEPMSGNGCHIKLWKYRYDRGGFELSTTLRSGLLPKKSDCLSKAQGKGLV